MGVLPATRKLRLRVSGKSNRKGHSSRLASLILLSPSRNRALRRYSMSRNRETWAPGFLSPQGGGEVAQGLERFAGGAGVDGCGGAGDSFFEVRGETGGFEGGSGVQEDDVAFGSALGSGEDGFENGGIVLRRVPALEMAER